MSDSTTRSTLFQDLVDLLNNQDFQGLKLFLEEVPPADSAEAFELLPEEQQALLFRLLPTGMAAEVFEYMPVENQERLVHAMGGVELAAILNAMSADDRTALFEELPTPVSARLVEMLSPVQRATALDLLNYPEDSVGRLMTSEYVRVRDPWSARRVLDHIRAHGRNSETLNIVYAVDEQQRLLGDIRIRDILLCPLDETVGELRTETVVSLNAMDHKDTAVEAFRKYDRTALPVVDAFGGLVGIVTVDDVLDVAEERATEDMQKIGGMEHLDEPYMEIGLFRLVKKRASWLIILFVGEMFTTTAMSGFENVLTKEVTIFLPLIISAGGNSGSQAATLIIRAMALGEVRLRDWWRVMRREIYSGLALGIILALVGMLRISLWAAFGKKTGGEYWPLMALAVGISLVGVVLWGSLSGSMLPFLLKKVGLDPASSSAPFVATLVDVTGLLIYFYVAMHVLKGTLL
jgi:magnesium transporter